MRIRPIVSLAASLLSAGALSAQSNPPMSPAAALPQWRSFLGANPLGIPLDIVSAEFETAVSSGGTIGVLGSYNDINHRHFTTFDARLKYYPGEVALQGFAIGLSVGYTKFNGELVVPVPPGPSTPPARGDLKSSTLGVLIDYNWAQGPSGRFIVGTGVGAKRILVAQEKRDAIGLPRAYVTGRFVIGLLF